MQKLIIDSTSYARELNLRRTSFQYEENYTEDIASYFLLKEMLRKIVVIRKTIGLSEENQFFNGLLHSNYKEFSNLANSELQEKNPDLSTSVVNWEPYGFIVLRAYTIFEILKYNRLCDIDENPFDYGMRVLERGNILGRASNPKGFNVNGMFSIPILLSNYDSAIPYITSCDERYLTAINNCYQKTSIRFSLSDDSIPNWLKEDNERGYISDAYKEWL